MIRKFPLHYAPANEERMIHLYLPDEYDDARSAEVRYPVIYMFDGHNLFYDSDATYGKSWGLKDFLDRWQKKVIVVGMEYELGYGGGFSWMGYEAHSPHGVSRSKTRHTHLALQSARRSPLRSRLGNASTDMDAISVVGIIKPYNLLYNG